MDGTRAVGNLSNNDSKIQNEFDNCTDDKVSVYETVITGGNIKPEPCDVEGEEGTFNYADIKDENADVPAVIVPQTGLMIDIKRNCFKYCEDCGEEYDLYCLKCPMLIRVFNSNNRNRLHNRVKWTLPTKIIDICETPSGVGMVALRGIPKGVVFGPFEGLDSTKNGTASKWKLKYNMLVCIRNLKQVNWMQYIRRADQSSNWNLTAFQYEDELYYRSDCHISVGDELLVYLDSGKEKTGIDVIEDGYFKPQACERLDDAYACTLCCLGYKSVCHLAAHNSNCSEKKNQEDYCKEIVQCTFCKIYLDEKEYSDYHIDACCRKNSKKYVPALRSSGDTDKPKLKNKFKCTTCEYTTSLKQTLSRHQLRHAERQMYKCPECPYRARQKHFLQQHLRTHAKRSRRFYVCEQCGERFSRPGLFTAHKKTKHPVSTYKCHNCAFETTNRLDFRRHMVTHKDDKSYLCNKCDKQFRSKNSLVAHVKICQRKKKEYKCPKCDFETVHSTTMKTHMLNIHAGAQQFKCRRCVYKTYFKKTFDRHIQYHEDTKPTKWESYDIEFWNARLIVRYKKVANAAQVDDKRFACTLCPYKTKKKSHLRQHLAVHCDDKPFECDICQQMFKHLASLTRHTRNVHSKARMRNTTARAVRIIIKPLRRTDN